MFAGFGSFGRYTNEHISEPADEDHQEEVDQGMVLDEEDPAYGMTI